MFCRNRKFYERRSQRSWTKHAHKIISLHLVGCSDCDITCDSMNPFKCLVGHFGRVISPSQVLYMGNITKKNADIQQFPKRDSKPRSQCLHKLSPCAFSNNFISQNYLSVLQNTPLVSQQAYHHMHLGATSSH
jgi:hypothetical protein